MNQESLQSWTLQQELEEAGGLPLTHNTFFQEVFQWLELAKAFLRLVLQAPILAKLDIDNLTVEPKDFLSVVFRETHADMIYRVPIVGRNESLCVYVLLEHKSYNDRFAIFQADGYAGQISQKEYLKAEDEKRLTADFRLSPVLVIIFHHGDRPFTGPIEVAELYEDCDGVLADYIPRRRAFLFDLSTIPELELPDDPEVPALYAVLRIMQVIFSLDLSTKIREVLERLKPYSERPRYRRLIRLLWFYFVSYGKKQSNQEVTAVADTVKQIIGEKEMTTILEHYIAEGEARGEARGKVRGKILATLELRIGAVPQWIENAIQSTTDSIALDSLAAHAKTCKSLEEFAEALK